MPTDSNTGTQQRSRTAADSTREQRGKRGKRVQQHTRPYAVLPECPERTRAYQSRPGKHTAQSTSLIKIHIRVAHAHDRTAHATRKEATGDEARRMVERHPRGNIIKFSSE